MVRLSFEIEITNIHMFLIVTNPCCRLSRGGIECASYVPLDLHVLECVLWILFLLLLVYLFKVLPIMRKALTLPTKLTFVAFDYVLAALHLALFLQVVYYKIHLRSLCYLLQPCHLALLWQGAVLVWPHPARLPLFAHAFVLLPGAALALVYPATEGLDFYLEAEAFFVQHYVLLFTPIYALCRHNFLLLQQISFPLLVFGNIVSIIFHWLFYVVSILSIHQFIYYYFLYPDIFQTAHRSLLSSQRELYELSFVRYERLSYYARMAHIHNFVSICD